MPLSDSGLESLFRQRCSSDLRPRCFLSVAASTASKQGQRRRGRFGDLLQSRLVLFAVSLILASTVGALPFWLHNSPNLAPFLRRAEWAAYDQAFRFRGPGEADHVSIVAIDDQSLRQPNLGVWPWDRRVYAQTIKRLKQAGARVIAFDMTFSEEQAAYPGADKALADAAKAAGNVVFPWKSEEAEGGKHEEAGIMRPIPELEDASVAVPTVDVKHDEDGILRKFYLFIRREELQLRFPGDPVGRNELVAHPSFAVAIAGLYLGMDPKTIAAEIAKRRFASVPIDSDPEVREWLDVRERSGKIHRRPSAIAYRAPIYFLGPSSYGSVTKPGSSRFGTVPIIPISDVLLEANFEPYRKQLQDQIVIIGATAEDLQDIHSTPFGRIPGPEVQANAIETLIHHTYVRTLPPPVQLAAILAASFVICLTTFLLKPVRGLFPLMAVLAGLSGGFLYLFIRHRIWLQVVGPLFSCMLSYLSITVLLFLTEERAARHVRGLLRGTVGGSVMDTMVRNPRLELGGELRAVTMLFTDLQGFTTISAKIPPQEVVSIINPYLQRMTEIIFDHQGTLDKFMGDGIMAYFGAPIPFEDHAQRAVLCAIEMQDALAQMRAEAAAAGRPQLIMRIGIHTGEAVVGQIGASERFEYTVIGDPVNVSARLEQLNKEYGSQIMISGATYAQAQDVIEAEFLGETTVRGRDIPIEVYKVMGRKQAAGRPAGATEPVSAVAAS